MASVIEHQKVERRRRVHRRLQESGISIASPVIPRAARRRPAGLYQRASRCRRGTPARSVSRMVMQRVSDVVRGIGTIGTSVARRVRRPMWIRSIAITFDERDAPLYAATIAFAVLANMALLSLGSDRLILSGAVAGIELPQQRELVVQSSLAPADNEFAVIGEIASVDPRQFERLEVTEYTVQPGDTLGEIALQYDLEMDTLISFNQIEDVRRLQVGDTYQIPNRDGLLYTVRRGDSVASIAADHGTTVNAILDANDLRSQAIDVGQVLFVPGGRLNETELRIILGELFAWPTRGTFTSGFGMRADPFTGLPRFHNGIDMANAIGTPIRAAASGRVVHIESQIGNYGRFVIVRHPDGFQTLYAHLNDFSVRNGQYVDRGQILGRMGNTGRSTGPHLHFSVIHNGTFVDPLRYLH